jgi:hypothetical protein
MNDAAYTASVVALGTLSAAMFAALIFQWV